jgi:phosphoribosyl 1,2-cyclic phosphodiesterase
MEITIWGSRGSVPVSGASFGRYGGATTCVEVALPGGGGDAPPRVLVDAGTGLTELGKRWGDRAPRALLLQSHMHWDHIQGFPFYAPLFDPAMALSLWAVPREGQGLRAVLDAQMRRPTFPIGLDILPSRLDFLDIAPCGDARIGGLRLRWQEVCHPSGSTAWRLDYEGASVVITGDVEAQGGSHDALVSLARGADLLIMDAQYFPEEYLTRRGFGHSTPLDAARVAAEARVGRLLLTHHDPNHDDARLDAKVALARRAARGVQVDNAFDGLRVSLGEAAPSAALA